MQNQNPLPEVAELLESQPATFDGKRKQRYVQTDYFLPLSPNTFVGRIAAFPVK